MLAAAGDGGLIAAIPGRKGTTLVALDATGAPRAGWPVVLEDAAWCHHVLPAPDGSIRVVCWPTSPDPQGPGVRDQLAYALGADGRLLPGWPVTVPYPQAARVVGRDLVLANERWSKGPATSELGYFDAGDDLETGFTTRVSPTGAVSVGEDVPLPATYGWQVGPDGTIFVSYQADESGVLAFSDDGLLWDRLVVADGWVSPPTVAPDGRVVVTAGWARRLTQLLALDPSDGRILDQSPDLRVRSVYHDSNSCRVEPPAPVVSGDGTVYLVLGMQVYAFDAVLRRLGGKPIDLPWYPASVGLPSDGDGLSCEGGVLPSAGRTTLNVALDSGDAGGSVVAVDRAGLVPGRWPVTLRQEGAEFWIVEPLDDGAVAALAVEPEAKGRYSATILGLSAAGKVRYRTIVLDP